MRQLLSERSSTGNKCSLSEAPLNPNLSSRQESSTSYDTIDDGPEDLSGEGGGMGLEPHNVVLDKRVSFRKSNTSAYKTAYLNAIRSRESVDQPASRGIFVDSMEAPSTQGGFLQRRSTAKRHPPPVGFERKKTARTKNLRDSYKLGKM